MRAQKRAQGTQTQRDQVSLLVDAGALPLTDRCNGAACIHPSDRANKRRIASPLHRAPFAHSVRLIKFPPEANKASRSCKVGLLPPLENNFGAPLSLPFSIMHGRWKVMRSVVLVLGLNISISKIQK